MRVRNLWGWGFLDRFPDDNARRALAARVCAVLGEGAAGLRPVPTADTLALPSPRVAPPAALARFTTADPAVRAAHSYGKAYRDQVRAFRGDFAGAPDFVALPEGEADVEALLDWATGARVAVVPFGGGTSVVGGVEPIPGAGHTGAVSLDLARLDRVLEVDPISRAARIQAGATGPRLEEQLSAAALTLRHYPQSFELSTLGGWIATRAGGHYATLYTHIDDLVESTR